MVSRKEYLKEWYKKNRDRQRAAGRKNYEENKEAYKRRAREWEAENPERMKELKDKWRHSEKGLQQSCDWTEKNRKEHNETNARSKKKHVARVRAECRGRQAAKLHRTPAWADHAAILAIYVECERRNQATGVKHVVDHEIPLQGESVSGLHVASNLQILTEQENLSKGNKLLEVS